MKNKLKALIVDDERLARKELISMLAEYTNIEIAGEAEDVSSAKSQNEKLQPDIIFLDIQMPKYSGFELLPSLDSETVVIFVTAFDEYALRAFEVNAMDYLMKPVNPERLKNAIERVFSEQKENVELSTRQLQIDDTLFLSINSKMQFIKINTIEGITSAGDYSEIWIEGKKKGLVLKPMKEWEQRLPEKYFQRIHRSTIINLECIDKMEEWFNHSYKIYLKNISEPFVISRRYIAKLKNLMG